MPTLDRVATCPPEMFELETEGAVPCYPIWITRAGELLCAAPATGEEAELIYIPAPEPESMMAPEHVPAHFCAWVNQEVRSRERQLGRPFSEWATSIAQ